MKKIFLKNKGFTLAELMIAIVVLGIISTFAFSIYTNFFDSVRDLKAGNLVYEEARFLMERIVKEVRNGTIDYEEYFNQSKLKQDFPDSYDYIRNETYTDDYCQYSRQFYNVGPDNEIGTLDDESTGIRTILDPVDGFTRIPPAIGRLTISDVDEPDPIHDNLFIININGDERSFIRRTEKEDSNDNTVGRVGLLKLTGEDYGVDHLNAFDPYLDGTAPDPNCESDTGEGDGRVDTWSCADGFICEDLSFTNPSGCQGVLHNVVYDPAAPDDNSFTDITPVGLDVVDLKFIVAPMDDPRKAFDNDVVQIQPHVTIRLTVRAAPALTRKFNTNHNPNIVLETTISARVYNEIVTECNLKQCTPAFSPDKDCPFTVGVCGPNASPNPAQQSCVDYVWEGCNAATYESYSDVEWGKDMDPFFGGSGRTYFEAGTEFDSCDDNYDTCTTVSTPPCNLDVECCLGRSEECKSLRCNDTLDNNCSGSADENDPACNFFLCNDGFYDPAVEAVANCIDVGGLCQDIRPIQDKETSCNDGHDNDCDGYADQFDTDCVQALCSNGVFDADTDVALYVSTAVDLFIKLDYSDPDYLLDIVPADHVDETLDECSGAGATNDSPDIGGLCELCVNNSDGDGVCNCGDAGCTTTKVISGHDQVADGSETAALCIDGLDNDCDGDADELDDDCLETLCSNKIKNCDLAPPLTPPSDYLVNYSNSTCVPPPLNLNDEVCSDVGGVCNTYIFGAIDHAYRSGGEIDGAAGQAEEIDLCTDELDNDCSGLADWQDVACCPQNDADGYLAESSGGGNPTCNPPGSVDLDCNDLNTAISPVATEVCNLDTVVYTDPGCVAGTCTFPAGYTDEPALANTDFPFALLGQSIDNNCSFANGLTISVDDEDDPSCCIDLDGDGYGIAEAYVYRAGLLGCMGGSPAPPAIDCDDTSASIHPNATENTNPLCTNETGIPSNEHPTNDNCAYVANGYAETVPQANHIDWYRDKDTTWLAWYGGVESFDDTVYAGAGFIDMAADMELFEPLCCNLGAVENCDDNTYGGGDGSDENCNGLEGYNDDYCVTDDDTTFFDTFTSATYIQSTDAFINHSTAAGTFTLTDVAQVNQEVVSQVVPLNLAGCTTYDAGLAVGLSEPGTTSIALQLTDDGGATWCGDDDCVGDFITSGEIASTAINFNQTNLRWRAELSGDGASTPVLSDITITYSNCL